MADTQLNRAATHRNDHQESTTSLTNHNRPVSDKGVSRPALLGQWPPRENSWDSLRGIVPLAVKKYSVEFKDACVPEVIRNSRPIARVARENAVVEQTLRNWVNAYKKENPVPEDELSVSERARLKELEAEVRDLRAENEFLGKATAFFAKKFR